MAACDDILAELTLEASTRLSEQLIADWKTRGGKVVGWVCHYAPEEVLHAAGLLPIRVLGGTEPSALGSTYLHSNMCAFARSCLTQGLEGCYSFLDGLVVPHTCDAICKLYDLWRLYVQGQGAFAHMIDHPHQMTPQAHRYHLEELQRLRRAVEAWVGTPISDQALRRSIALYNENRSLLRRIWELRAQAEPPLSGAEAFDLVRSGMILPKEEHSRRLRELLPSLEGRRANGRGPRVLVSGSVVEGPDFVRLVEECGARVVIDNLCVGTKYFWDAVPEAGDPWEALSRRYMTQAPCACIYSGDKGLQHLELLIQQFRVEAVILYSLKFCDTYHYNFPPLRERLEKRGLPVLELESEHSAGAQGQLRTRIEAFLEMIAGR